MSDNWEQAGHFGLGLLCALFCGVLVLWWREFVKQWPPGWPYLVTPPMDRRAPGEAVPRGEIVTQLDRVEDLRRDYLFYSIGYTVGHVAQVVAVGFIAAAIVR